MHHVTIALDDRQWEILRALRFLEGDSSCTKTARKLLHHDLVVAEREHPQVATVMALSAQRSATPPSNVVPLRRPS